MSIVRRLRSGLHQNHFYNFWYFFIFEKECRVTRAVDKTPKCFYDFYILKKSVMRHERSIKHQNYFYNFLYFKKGSVMRRQNYFYNFLYFKKGSVMRRERSITHQICFYNFCI